jgi:outer membrane protein OmpA-like peptidoglycan-associated protein
MKNLISGLFVATLALAACTTPGKRTGIGTGAGAAGGAGLGAIIGHQVGNEAGGALIGAAVGGALGATIGNHMDRQAKELGQIAETQRTQDGIMTQLKNDLLFAVGSADLKPAAKNEVDQISGILKQYPEDHVIVVGYTDNTGSQAFNQQLSERRAQAVRIEMISAGMAASSVEAIGQGPSNPIGDNTTDAGRSRNRRVELRISADASKVK